MGSVQVFNNVVVNTRTGVQKIFGNASDPDKYFIVGVKRGHVGNGQYIPVFLPIIAKNKEMAIEIAINVGAVKKNDYECIVGIEEVCKEKHYLIEYINDCDPYITNPQFIDINDIEARRVIMPGLVAKSINAEYNKKKIPFDQVKTADQYSRLHVLQRYLAPRFYGGQLIFPKKINFATALEEHIYEYTIELGLMRNKLSMLSFYYQIYGPKNQLNINYKDGVLIYTDENNNQFRYSVPSSIKEHLDIAQEKFDKLQQEKIEEEQKIATIKLPSARDKFAERYKKYQNINPTNIK